MGAHRILELVERLPPVHPGAAEEGQLFHPHKGLPAGVGHLGDRHGVEPVRPVLKPEAQRAQRALGVAQGNHRAGSILRFHGFRLPEF